jgi:hypothetical protein
VRLVTNTAGFAGEGLLLPEEVWEVGPKGGAPLDGAEFEALDQPMGFRPTGRGEEPSNPRGTPFPVRRTKERSLETCTSLLRTPPGSAVFPERGAAGRSVTCGEGESCSW